MSTNPTPAYEIQQQFNAAWIASLPTAVQPLFGIADPAARLALFDSLIAQGYGRFLIVSLMLRNYDPYTISNMLQSLGYTWINSAIQIEVGYPGQYESPGIPPGEGSLGPYPLIPPPNTIAIPLSQTPYTPPKPVPPAPTDPVGSQVAPGSVYYLNAPGVNESNWPDGSEFTDARGKFSHEVTATPFGNESQWKLIQPA